MLSLERNQIHCKTKTEVIRTLCSKTYSYHHLLKNYSPVISVRTRQMCSPSCRRCIVHSCLQQKQSTIVLKLTLKTLHIIGQILHSPTTPSTASFEKQNLYRIKNTLKRLKLSDNLVTKASKTLWTVCSGKAGYRFSWWPVHGGISFSKHGHDLPSALATARNGIWSMTVLRRTGPLWVRRGLFQTTRFTPDLLITLKPSKRGRG